MINRTGSIHFFRLMLVAVLLILLTGCSSIEASSSMPTETTHSDESFPELEELGAIEGDTIIEIEVIIILMLMTALLVNIAANKLRIPYTVGLVLVGLGLTLIDGIPVISVSPELILALLVPPLVFEAAYHIDFNDMRRDLKLILVLAIPGVVLTTFLVGGVVSLGAGLAMPVALVFGALVAATDPIAVVALFRSLGVPRRLQLLLESESLLNDGTAIVIFYLMVTIALTGQFNLVTSVLDFLLVAGGGVAVGALLGVISSRLIARIDDHLVETTLTTVLAFGAYLVAEEMLGVSGVLAVVAAGLTTGNITPAGMSATTKIATQNFWEFAAFLANSFAFLLVGLQIDLAVLWENIDVIFWAILAVLVARAVSIYGLSRIGGRISLQWKNVLFWGGLRGAISLALVLSLTPAMPHYEQLQAMAFGVVLFTLLVQGLTMGPLVKRMGLVVESSGQSEYEVSHARVIAIRAAQARLIEMHANGLMSDFTWQKLQPWLSEQSEELTQKVRHILEQYPGLYEQEMKNVWREAMRAQRSSIKVLSEQNIISEKTYVEIAAEFDAELDESESSWSELSHI